MAPRSVFRIFLFILVLTLAACAGDAGEQGPAGPAGPAGPQGVAGPAGADAPALEVTDLSCADCHNETTLLLSVQARFEESHHATGGSWVRGSSPSCAGCHGSEGPEARIAAGLSPNDDSIQGVATTSPINCRTCHDVHMSYTGADWALTGGAAAVSLERSDGTYDKGSANLCAQCHQIRHPRPAATDGMIEVTSTRFGPHHGVESNMAVGEGGMGVTGAPGGHYNLIDAGCVSCHMGENTNHGFEAELGTCEGCHSDIESFDYNGTQTEIQALLDQIKPLLIAEGIIDSTILDDDGEIGNRSVPGTYSEEVVNAMWNYMYVVEDQSLGVHNPGFTRALLEYSLTALGG